MTHDIVKNDDGLKIYSRTWTPDMAAARGVVVIVHGFNSHSGYYEWVAQRLTAMGLVVTALDLRGRGHSEGERFFVEDFDQYVADVDLIVTHVKSTAPGLPLFLLGHSAGGVVSCLYALKKAGELAGLICESFAYRLPAPHIVLSLLKGLSHIVPHAHVLKLKNDDFSRDASVVAQMNADPLIANEVQPTLTLAAMVRADERLRQGFATLTLPLLILHGTADRAANYLGSEEFFKSASSPGKVLKLYDGHYHDLLNDTGKEVVMADIEAWLDARLPGASQKQGTPS
jgi:acylglycerol lipase